MISNDDLRVPISDNERMILDIVRRSMPIGRSSIAPRTNLTQQSVHRLIEGLIERGFLRIGAPLKGMRGQPSPTIELAATAGYSVGISVNTDSATLCLADFCCRIVEEEELEIGPQDRMRTLDALSERLAAMMARHSIARSQLIGLGFSISGFFVDEGRAFNAPEPLRDWSLIDLKPILKAQFGLPVWMDNNATTAAVGESLRGAGLWCSTFAYLSFNYGFGGGLILNGRPYHGFHGNAGEFSGIYEPEEAHHRPALQYLLRALQAEGVDVGSVEDMRRRFDPAWPGVEAWLDQTMPLLNRLVATLVTVLDPQAIVFGGQLPRALGEMMIARVRMPSSRPHRYNAPPAEARLVLAETAGDAAAIGAALMPLKMIYFL
ncbi:NagC family transcriptional regulator [Xaviernesmea oryzae]|uniref:NagC family transcriptional regulator n=1 Tax=Xaviernesmea oryzae TaxID=464029 RepID=A0A1Q9ATX2_9HYPH|nr:ROK family transcriptional regulator [Xaviernesmea oryzae]OLP58873.1 NagC family transcriptional regulator [Xaviernesmea oryzae]SEM03237.1 Sugar kinase of the NBD/HSP70 family, may contain an N-terminal HTH domain [Xaviernesmea oryzae]